MSAVDRFEEYAAKFEEVFESDDWSLLEPYFTEDAVYEIFGDEPFSGRYEGRDAVLGYLKQSVGLFDRRFDSRELEMLELRERGDAVVTHWRVTYRAGGAELSIEGEEEATFRGDRIQRLEDRFAPGSGKTTQAFLAEHGAKLGGQ